MAIQIQIQIQIKIKIKKKIAKRRQERIGNHTSANSAIAGEIRIACATVRSRASIGTGGSKRGTVVDPIGAIVDRCIRLRPKNEMIPSPQTEMLEQE